MTPFYREGDEGSERLGNLPKVTQLVGPLGAQSPVQRP